MNMNIKYLELVDQTYHFPQEEFTLDGEYLRFHDITNLVWKATPPLLRPNF